MAKRRRRGNRCRFCREKAAVLNYKDMDRLSELMTNQGRIQSRKRSGNCSRHQRQAKGALKRARFLALLPYT